MQLTAVKEALEQFKRLKIMVVGDMMLDHYIWGKVNRISPEAPVPVVNVSSEEYRLGGAANVVLNIKALEAIPLAIGVVGTDLAGRALQENFEEFGIESSYLVSSNFRQTTVKSRIIGNNQQVVRVDREMLHNLEPELEEDIIGMIENNMQNVDAVLIEDYNKGLLTPKVIAAVLAVAGRHKKIVTVDPKFKNFFAYRNCTVFKPNFSELTKNMGQEIETEADFIGMSKALQTKINAEWLVVTRGEKGLTIFSKHENEVNIPTFAREVYDVSGAGDAVISVITLALAAGLNIRQAALIANHAAGKVCGKLGTQPAFAQEIINSFNEHSPSF